MTRRAPRSLLNVDDARVNAVLIILGIRLADAVEAFVARPGHHVRRDDDAFVRLRRRVTAGLRELCLGGETLSFPEIARLVGTTGHSTVIGRCQTVRRLGLLSDAEITALRNGGAVASEEEAFRLIGSNFVEPERRDAMVEAMASRRGGG